MAEVPPVVGDRYQLAEPLGHGGMAVVWRGTDTRLGRPVAVKILADKLATDSLAQERFRREAQAAARLSHPAIVSVFDTGAEIDPANGLAVPYIVMELVEGSTLSQLQRSGLKLMPDRALEISEQVLDALSYSHQAGLIHRDIKPANVMLTSDGAVKVMDFGIARAVEDTSTRLTQTAAVVGTAHYLSPEQARGEVVDARSDIYSAGCLAYELLVGRPPFLGDSVVSLAYQHVREAPAPPSALNPDIGPEIDAVVMRALAKNPDDRYQSAADMRADVQRVLAGHAVEAAPLPFVAGTLPGTAAPTAYPPPPPATSPLPAAEVSRRRGGEAARWLGVALVVAVLGIGVYALLSYLQPGTGTRTAVVVPALLGSTREQADSRLRNADLKPQFRDVEGRDDKTVNTVTKQNPPAGVSAEPGSTVTLEVNIGSARVAIPGGLVGEDLDVVKDRLEAAGFERVQTERAEVEPLGSRKDEVLSVIPTEGTRVARSTEIVVLYAKGDAEPTTAPAPTTRSSVPTQEPEPAPTTKSEGKPEKSEKPEKPKKPPESKKKQ